MIEKARKIHPVGDYKHGQLPAWIPDPQYDFVVSMEFMYYLEDPFFSLAPFTIMADSEWMPSSRIDHYFENTESLFGHRHWGQVSDKSEKEWKGAMHRGVYYGVIRFREGRAGKNACNRWNQELDYLILK